VRKVWACTLLCSVGETRMIEPSSPIKGPMVRHRDINEFLLEVNLDSASVWQVGELGS
jgi:hypothetical protein